MKKYRKPLKFYLLLLGVSSIFILGYTLYMVIFNETPVSNMISTWFLPPLFIFIYFMSDLILDSIFRRKNKIDYEAKFLDAIGEKMRESNIFTIEDFRRLQINDKFQKTLTIAYKVYKDGENEVYNIEKLRRKFSKNSTEERAMEFVINYIEENIDKNGKKDQNKL